MKEPYSKAIVHLLKKTVEKNSPVWKDIINYTQEIQNYLSIIGLTLIVKEDEGFAYLKQDSENDDTKINLVPRKSVGFEISIILIVLRQILEDYDNNPTETYSMDKVISHKEIKEEVGLFLPEKYDKAKLERDLDNYIKRIVDLGYLKELNQHNDEKRYRIHRIIKEKVTIDDLALFKERLAEYANKL